MSFGSEPAKDVDNVKRCTALTAMRAAQSWMSFRAMKHFIMLLVVLCLSVYSANGSGIVIYRQQAFHSDAQAILKAYKTYTAIPQLVTVITESGQRIDIKSGQRPVVIPAPSESGVDKAKIIPAIEAAMQRFPQHRLKLEDIKKCWINESSSQAAPTQLATVSPTPSSDEGVVPIFKTRSGIEYKNFSIVKIQPNGITINYDEGLARISFFDLTDEQIKEYGLTLQAAEDFSKQQKETQRALAVKQQQESTAKQQEKDLKELENTNGFESFGTVFQVISDEGILYKGYKQETYTDIVEKQQNDGSLASQSTDPKVIRAHLITVKIQVEKHRSVPIGDSGTNFSFVECATEKVTEGDPVKGRLYRIGEYTYETRLGVTRTIPRYTNSFVRFVQFVREGS